MLLCVAAIDAVIVVGVPDTVTFSFMNEYSEIITGKSFVLAYESREILEDTDFVLEGFKIIGTLIL